jgi:peptide/nickel transport system substrate-binding protein
MHSATLTTPGRVIRPRARRLLALFLVALLLAGCTGDQEVGQDTALPEPSPARTATPTTGARRPNFITVAIDAPSRFQDFADIDEFGNVVGFEPDVMADLAAQSGFVYEFVVTSFSGLLASVANGEFDAAMSAIRIPDEPEEGLAYTIPYLEVGQVLLVRANETELLAHTSIGPGTPVGVRRFTAGEQTAREVVGLGEPDLHLYDTTPAAVQALIDLEVDGVIIDSDDALHFESSFPLQLKVAGVEGREAWITQRAYGIAVRADNVSLLETLNNAIEAARDDGTVERLIRAWLVPEETINAGESLVGTPANELIIGIGVALPDMDPAARDPDLISWDVKRNTMSGLLAYDQDNNLIPLLAEDLGQVSEDGLVYTYRLRSGLVFPDSSELTSEDVRFSITRAAGLGSFLVNRYLKDDNEDGFADPDAVQTVDERTVRFVLSEPTSHFPSLLASPSFYIVSDECFPATFDPVSTCGGIGPYTIVEWEVDEQMRLKANPNWPGQTAAFENIRLRFYDDPARMRRSLENGAIDLAWNGLGFNDVLELRADPAFTYWEGPTGFKSYLVFEQSESPWSSARLREAIALSVDRQALADAVFQGTRRPLISPVPDGTPGHVPSEPARDLAAARSILIASGYSTGNKLQMTLWYVSDERYSVLEGQYARALKEQLEETDLITVTVEGAPWETFRPQSIGCNYPAYLLGWPSSGQPANFLDAMSWMEYFITNTDRVCSNYESSAMDALLEQAREQTDTAARLEIYGQIQELWAREFPTLDLTQEPRVAFSLPKVQDVFIDAMGLLHYNRLTKTGG